MSITVIYHAMSFDCTISVSLRRVVCLSQWFITQCLWVYCRCSRNIDDETRNCSSNSFHKNSTINIYGRFKIKIMKGINYDETYEYMWKGQQIFIFNSFLSLVYPRSSGKIKAFIFTSCITMCYANHSWNKKWITYLHVYTNTSIVFSK